MITRDDENKTKVELWCVTKIPDNLYREKFNFQNLTLDVSRLDIPIFDELHLELDKNYSTRIKGKLVLDIIKHSEEYNILHKKNKNGFIDEFFEIQKFIDSLNCIPIFENICIEIAKYLRIKKRLNPDYFSGVFEFQPEINCTWEIDGEIGCVYGINHILYEVVEVCDIVQEYAVIDSSTFLDLYKRKEAKNLEPVYHELLIEAEKAIFNNSIRSGLLILYSAIEVATRRFVREVNEESDYINDRLDWVKLVELYKDYINKNYSVTR
jgi:hypothetical protein